MKRSYFFKTIFAWLFLLCVIFIPVPCSRAESLSIEDAVESALAKDPSVESAGWDWLSACAKAEEARWKMLPSLTVAAGYQKLSDLPPASMSIMGTTIEFPETLTNIYSFSANLQYPVFAGFRIREAAAIAGLQCEGKQLALEMVKRALRFEVQRAYWEAVRITLNVQMLSKNLELTTVNRDLTAKHVLQGAATQVEQLTADLRYKQAVLDLGDAVTMQDRAYLILAGLTGKNGPDMHLTGTSPDAALPFSLSTQPDAGLIHDFGENPDETALIMDALARRPETRMSDLSIRLAEHSRKLAQAGLYPTVALTGNYIFADPNPRAAFQTDPAKFTGTWAVGIQLSYDLGGLPGTIKETEAQACGINKARSDRTRQQNMVVMDVRTCLLSLTQASRDLALTKGMVDQAAENLRVIQQKVDLGMAGNADLLNARLSLLRVNFTVMNKRIDLQIASSDLSRAIAIDDIR